MVVESEHFWQPVVYLFQLENISGNFVGSLQIDYIRCIYIAYPSLSTGNVKYGMEGAASY